MTYTLDVVSERGMPLAVACRLDLAGRDPTCAGASMLLQVRRARGDAAVLLEMTSAAGELAATATGDGAYAIALTKSAAAMSALAAGTYVYGLMLSGAGAPDEIIAEGAWTHAPLLVQAD